MAPAPLICTQISSECPIKYTVYGYRPNAFVNGIFAIFFAISFGVHIWLGVRYRIKSYTIALTLGCFAQVLGYLGRLGLYFQPFGVIPFQVQVCCLIIAPAFNSAAVYLMLKHIVQLFGPQWSILRPKQYTAIFITADVISLVLQATGGGLAVTAGRDNKDQVNLGNDVMMAGIAFQVVTLSIFAISALLYVVRRVKAHPSSPFSSTAFETWRSTKFRWFLFGLIAAFTTIFIRCVYRIAEMRGGWGNPIMKDQIAFIILEGCMILFATTAQTVLHPGHFFPEIVDIGMKSDDSPGTWTEITEMPILSK
ncbi:Fc.00g056790.m01.CDS01 [Cosmosporella sp. VM-42]